jgi:hypothetical protein
MNQVACSASKSPDLLIWRCSPCIKFKNIRAGQKLSPPTFLTLIFYFGVKSLTSIAISQLIGMTEKTISDWRTHLHTRVDDWLVVNPSPLF